ncbi:uncharacterized protein [Halyomorpha halys]|uniref:uncharacterized protein isoform X1 n=1 Tax=Halyomorpha halys TaxID=286706 RepID=UPI0006D50233|nr:uncharacterized protein LOC106680350 isoform X1 [Halyomorpha halys]
MTGTPQNPLQIPLYKICCLIPYQVNEQDIVYLSSVSEVNRFLQVHGIGDKFGRSSTATCTEDLPIIHETKKIVITNDVEEKRKETYDRQIQYNWKNANNLACYRNEMVSWHKCSKNESVIHFCKKSSSSLSDHPNNCSPSENIKKETPTEHKTPNLEDKGDIMPTDSTSLKETCQKSRSNVNKKGYSFSNRSFIRILKKRNKNLPKSVTKSKKETVQKEKSSDMCDKTLNTKMSLLLESVVCETSNESYKTGALADTTQEKVILDEIKAGEALVAPANTTAKSPLANSIPKDGDYEVNFKTEKEVENSDEMLDTLSDESSTLDCTKEEQNNQYVDLSFYESPSKFVENMSEWVMRRFIKEECEDSWLKIYQGKKIPEKYLGIDKDLSELYILKKMSKHETTACLISHLTPRQKRLLAKGIVRTLEEFNINGSRWGGLSREILNKVCKFFKIQQGFVS